MKQANRQISMNVDVFPMDMETSEIHPDDIMSKELLLNSTEILLINKTMRMKSTFFVLVLTVLFSVCSGTLRAQFTVDGEFRPRMIIDQGYKTPKLSESPALTYISQRTRLNTTWRNERIEAYLSIQDVRFWGDDNITSSSGMLGNSNSLSLHQAWVMFKPDPGLKIKIGRQSFSYDDQRILSARNWNDYQVTYDAVFLGYSNKIRKIDLAASWNTDGASDPYFPKNKLKLLDFIRYEQQLGPVTVSAISILTGFTRSDTTTALAIYNTSGLNATYRYKGFSVRTTGYYQFNLNSVQTSRAFCLSVLAQQSLPGKKFRAGLGLDWLSGNDETRTDADYTSVNHKFNSYYGNRHGLLGYMDYYNSIPSRGLKDAYFRLEYTHPENLGVQADLHQFFMSEKGYESTNSTNLSDKNLGLEFDLVVRWKFMEEATIEWGYSCYGMTETLKQWKGVAGQSVSFPQFTYLLLTVKPRFEMK